MAVSVAQRFADAFRSGAQGADMDCDAAQALALDITALNARIAELEDNERAYEEIIGKKTYREVADELAATHQSSPESETELSSPDGLADFVKRCRAYLEDRPGYGGHSDAAGSNAYELIEEAIEHCLPPSRGHAPKPAVTKAWAVLHDDGTPNSSAIWTKEPGPAVKEMHERHGIKVVPVDIACSDT